MRTIKYYILFFLLSVSFYAQNNQLIELKSIQFIGNNSISSSELGSVIFSKESPGSFSKFLNSFSSFGEPPIFFDSLLIPQDILALKMHYQSNGFFKAKISSKYEIENDEATLYFFIEESQPAIFNSLIIKGLENKIPGDYLEIIRDYTSINGNTTYRDAILEEKKNYTISFLRDNGYMLAQYDQPLVLVDTTSNSVSAEINFRPGKRYKISNIYTSRTGQGMEYVEDQLIKDIVGIKPDMFYSYYDIQRGQVRLYRTGLFNSALINAIISDTSGNNVPLNISADIGMLNELSPEIIVNNEDNTFNLGVGISFTKKNFLGNARKLTLSTSAAAQNISEFIKKPAFNDSTVFGYTDTRIILEQPFLFGRPINTKLESYFTLQKRKNEYNSTLYGAKLSFDFELQQFTYLNSLSTYFNIERSEYTYKKDYLINLLSIYYQRIPDANIEKAEADSLASDFVNNELGGQLISKSTNALLGFVLGTNKTDNLFFPTSGYTLSLLMEEANAIPYIIASIANAEFNRPLSFKLLASTTVFFPVFSSTENSFGIKLKTGQIFTYKGDKADISLNQRFYSGGSNSIRGWSTRQLVPIIPLMNLVNPSQEDLEAILTKGAATGGFFTVEGSLEARIRLLGKIGSAFFIDFGNTWNDYSEFQFDQVAVATGFGFRYYSEFAPIRLDFGFKLYDPNDTRNFFSKRFWKDLIQFHIGIGEAF